MIEEWKELKPNYLGLAKPMRGENNPTCKITENKAKLIKEYLKNKTCTQIAKELNTTIHIVKDISRGKTWKHLL